MKINFKFDKRFWLVFLSLFFMLFFMNSIRWIYHNFQRVNFDEIGIVLGSGMGAGADKDLFWSYMTKAILNPLWLSLLIAVILQVFKKSFLLIVLYLVLGVLFIHKMLISNIEVGSFFNFEKSNFYETEYVDPQKTEIDWAERRNVVFIALESIEKVYGTAQISGEVLTPNITKLEQENKSFENYHSVAGLTHTIAAITGFTTGLPLFFTSYTGMDKMVKAYGIGSIFKDAGYQTWSIFPATGKFSSKSNFMYKKGFEHVLDGEFIRANLENPPKEAPFYGVDDGTFFEYSKSVIKDIVKTKQPYFIFMETLNPHCRGFFTEYCKKIGFKQEAIEDIIKCDDKIIYDFVRWMQKTDPTAVIILINDHKQHTGGLMKQLEKIENRPLANVFINTKVLNKTDKNRLVSAMDFFPTVIDSAGGKIKGCKLGLGVSLSERCKNEKTLRERFSDDELKTMLEKKNDLYYYLATGKDRK